MSIWFSHNVTIDMLNNLSSGTMSELLGIQFSAIKKDSLEAIMPVDNRTRQPYGILHGGASVVLAETLGSVASALIIDPETTRCVGLEINANHIRSVSKGFVKGLCTPLHLGSSTHVWDIRIFNAEEELVCISRLTVAILKKRKE
jgi:1,4-dihydroxy-2-naphthoyl-CoA hydrolase